MATRTETRAAESSADPDALVALLADLRRAPEWAPDFADAVSGDAETGWQVTKGDSTFDVEVATNAGARTVDYLREVAPGRRGGAYLRALPRPGGGSVVMITVPVAPGTDPAATAATLDQELRALTRLAEAPGH